ncbi:hypothetical protein F5Y16DRAFT_407165 [Xylariaceae sp. FL0255]|nr:hypothetical protein F5Y16DRAFT_407165 [Xylariaceae sp. FL0255]
MPSLTTKDLLRGAGVILCFTFPAQAVTPKYMLVFGDSYSTTTSWVVSAPPSTANPIGNPSWPGETTSGGLNWVGNAIAKYNSTLVFAYDLAVTGAVTNDSIVSTYAEYNFDDQVDTLLPDYLLPWTISAEDTLVAVWCGINDVGTSFWDGESAAPLIPSIMDSLFGLLNLYAEGLRNFVLFTPSFTTVLSDPTAYGAPDATCYNSDGYSCLWYDNYHPGLVIHEFLGQALVEAVDFF